MTLLQKKADDYIEYKKRPQLWLFSHLNWLHFDQPGLHFRAKQSNIRHGNSPRSCHPVCSLHVPHRRFPVEAKIALTEEVCVAIQLRKLLNLTCPKAAEIP